ncbi:MAG: CHASE2 domain-containing protein [Luteolibacter sp.]
MEKNKSTPRSSEFQSRWRQIRINALICLVAASVIAAFIGLNSWRLQRFELWLGDELTQSRGGGTVDDRLVLVGIDDPSLNVLDYVMDEQEVLDSPELDAMSFGYPFPRSVWAALTQKLIDAGASLVVYDVIFAGEGEGDAAFKAVIEANPQKVVIGCDVVIPELGGDQSKPSVVLPSPSVIEQVGPMDPRVGLVKFFPNDDLKIREMTGEMRIFGHEEDPLRHSLAIAALKQTAPDSEIKNIGVQRPIKFPDFSGGSGTYVPISLHTLFLEEYWEKNYKGGDYFKDKIVYVGGCSTTQFHDDVNIPAGTILGVQLQMTALAAASSGEYYSIVGKKGQIISVLLMALVVFGIAFMLRRPLLGLLILCGCAAAYLGLVPWLYYNHSLLLPSASPLLTLGLAGLGVYGSRYAMERLEKAKLRRVLERQMSKELADHILSMPEGYFQSLPGVRKPVTILFSDIRSFTNRSEKDDPVELVKQLKEYMNAMGRIVFENQGVVDKFIGDAVMGVWGLMQADREVDDARSAVAAAVAMQRRLRELNAKWAEEGREPFHIGIGLNHGDVIFGMMGSEEKEEMTVIGDAVNQAARIEGLTKKFGQEIIIGPRVAEKMDGLVPLRSLGRIRTFGKDEAEELFAVLTELPGEQTAAQEDWLNRYNSGLKAYQVGDLEKAREDLQACHNEKPDDLTCSIYLEAIERGDDHGDLVLTGK